MCLDQIDCLQKIVFFAKCIEFTKPDRWYKAENHVDELRQFVGSLARSDLLDCLDVFGASRRISNTFIGAGYEALSYDIKLDSLHDICSKTGVEELFRMGMQFLDVGQKCFVIPRLFVSFCLDYLETKAFDSSTKIGGLSPSVFVNTLWCPLIMYSFPRLRADALLMLCPPCSLYSPACQSAHQRTEVNPLGNLKNFKVRLALRIWSNMATRMIRMHSFVFFLQLSFILNSVLDWWSLWTKLVL